MKQKKSIDFTILVLGLLLIIAVFASSCTRYIGIKNCKDGHCGVWYPKKFKA